MEQVAKIKGQTATRRMALNLTKRTPRNRAAAVMIAASFLCLTFLGYDDPVVYSQNKARVTARRQAPPARYSQFPHSLKAHQRECSSCHTFPSANWKAVRAAAEAFPDATEYPKHESCLDCHMPQFFRGARPAICSICHVNPSPRDSRRHPFPNPREIFDLSAKGKTAVSDFQIKFPHATHIEIVSGLRTTDPTFTRVSYSGVRRAEESCTVCHKTIDLQGDSSDEYSTKPPADLGEGFWLRKGTFKSRPTSHTTCFTCHSADTGISPAPTACASCHALRGPQPTADFDAKLAKAMNLGAKTILDAWRDRDSSGKFRHEWFSHAELSCSTCHTVEKINTLDPGTKKVSIAACGTCHATATSDDGGALNYEADSRKKDLKFQCTKCHVIFGKQPIPPSHIEALKEAGAK